MSLAARLNGRITQLAVGRQLPHRTVRMRLTLLYSGLILLSGAALVAITYVLFQQATEYTKPHLPNIPHAPAIQRVQLPQLPRFLPQLTQDQYQLAQDQHQLAHALPLGKAGPGIAYSVPLLEGDQHRLARDQHQLAQAVDQLAGAVHQVAQAGSVQAAQRAVDSHQLLVNSGIALAIMAVLALLAGWLVAGRVLQPLEDSYRAQRQFVANASHELRAPLTRQRALIEGRARQPGGELRLTAWSPRARTRIRATPRAADRRIARPYPRPGRGSSDTSYRPSPSWQPKRCKRSAPRSNA